jgi:hypothetical protein
MRTDRHRQDKASAASTRRKAMEGSRWLWSIDRISKTLLTATLGAARLARALAPDGLDE